VDPLVIALLTVTAFLAGTVDNVAMTASQAGAGVVEPIPAGWNDCR